MFYGRVSTRDNQEEWSSRRWQYENAERVIAEAGVIVQSFFDAGVSRSLSWTARPQARALLAAAADPRRGFDAVIVGEYERGFSGGQLLSCCRISRGMGWRCGCRSSPGRST